MERCVTALPVIMAVFAMPMEIIPIHAYVCQAGMDPIVSTRTACLHALTVPVVTMVPVIQMEHMVSIVCVHMDIMENSVSILVSLLVSHIHVIMEGHVMTTIMVMVVIVVPVRWATMGLIASTIPVNQPVVQILV